MNSIRYMYETTKISFNRFMSGTGSASAQSISNYPVGFKANYFVSQHVVIA
ncbi:MAG: hypothetical protein KF775_10775 [Cyclobacteriaceae bacterium]|nr:hypothetical protein [Cyclobacteriaceae bacterium]